MTPDLSALEISEENKGPDMVTRGNGHGLHIKSIGHTTLSSSNNQFHLKNTLHVSAIEQQMLSLINLLTTINALVNLTLMGGFRVSSFSWHSIDKKVLLKC